MKSWLTTKHALIITLCRPPTKVRVVSETLPHATAFLQTMHNSLSPKTLQPGVGLGLLQEFPPSFPVQGVYFPISTPQPCYVLKKKRLQVTLIENIYDINYNYIRSNCDSHCKRQIKYMSYKTLRRPILTYGSECWPLSKKDGNMLRIFERRILTHSLPAI